MAKNGVPYESDMETKRDVDFHEDIPNRDDATAEKLEKPEVYEVPVPVRIVEDSKPRQHMVEWDTTTVPVAPGEAVRLLGYQGNRKQTTLHTLTTGGVVYVGRRASSANDVKGFPVPDGATGRVTVPGPQDIYAYNPEEATDTVYVAMLTETVVEIG